MFRSVICLSMFQSCVYDPPQKGICVLNYTQSAIYVAYSFNDSIDKNNKLCLFDTEFFNGSKHIISPQYRIDAYNTKGIGISGRDELFNIALDKKLRLFFITEKTMKYYSWEEICNKKMYVEKKCLTIDDLKRTNWMIRYSK